MQKSSQPPSRSKLQKHETKSSQTTKMTNKSQILTQKTQKRTFSFYDVGSAVGDNKRRGPRPSTKPKGTSSSPQQRYEHLTRGSGAGNTATNNSDKNSHNNNSQNRQNNPRQTTTPHSSQTQPPPTNQQGNNNTNNNNNDNHDNKRSTAGNGDFESVFKNSRLTPVFTTTPTHKSFWTRMNDGDTVYLTGTRRLVDPHGRSQDSTFCLLQRTIDKHENKIHDRLVAMDYDSGMPFEQYLTTSVDGDLSHATATDKDQESGDVISRTFLRLRGEPWQWHSAVAMSKIEPRVQATMSQEYLDSLPDTYAISRVKFSENGLLAEKLIKQNDKIVLTIFDDLKLTTQKLFEQKCEKVFNDYSQMLTEQIERNAQQFSDNEGGDAGGQRGGNEIDPSMFSGGAGIRPKM
jgi:hypothetical protein